MQTQSDQVAQAQISKTDEVERKDGQATDVKLQAVDLSSSKQANAGTSPSPPAEDGGELSVPRKREREVSLEPSTPQATTLDIDTGTATVADAKDRRTPAKKNRLSSHPLDATQEEDSEDQQQDIPEAALAMSCSPPHETKITQIRQGVEDLTWRNRKKGPEVPLESHRRTPSDEDELNRGPGQEQKELVSDQMDRGEELPENKFNAMAETPAPMQAENPPAVYDDGDDDHGGEADPAEQPPDAQPSVTSTLPASSPNGEHLLADTTSQLATSSVVFPQPSYPTLPPPHGYMPRLDSESDVDQEKGVKRKLGDRSVSQRLVPGEKLVSASDNSNGESQSAISTGAKRQRDDDADANPRLNKRPTPPPEEEAGPSTKGKSQPSSTASAAPAAPPAAPSKLSGFMAYATSNSPFAAVKGPNLFASANAKPSPWASASNSSAESSSKSSHRLGGSTSLLPPPSSSFATKPDTSAAHKRTGFEAFASSTSPFASAAKRPKSPPPPAFGGGLGSTTFGRPRSPSRHLTHANSQARTATATSAFSAYASGGAQGFVTPNARRSGSGSPFGDSAGAGSAVTNGTFGSGARPAVGSGVFGGGGRDGLRAGEDDSEKEGEKEDGKRVSFGERLRAGKDDDQDEESEEGKVALTEQEVETGEEDEDTVFQVRGKLFALGPQNQWKERGTGTIKLNVRRDDGSGARLLMRKEAVYTVLLNATLFKGMKCFLAQDPRYLRFSVFEGGTTTHYNLRVSNAKIAEELLEEINSHIPNE